MSIVTYKKERDLVTLGYRVTDKMENNTVFPAPPAALADLKKALPEFQIALTNAKSRDKEMIAIKNKQKANILALLEELANYVVLTCKGDKAFILSSGFDVTEGQSNPTAPSIQALEVELGAAGEATTRVKKTAGGVAYLHQYATEAPGPNTVWISEGNTTGIHKFTGLSSDKRYWFRVVVVGRKGQKAYSPVVSRSIQ